MSIAKLTGTGKLLEAGRHNKREIHAEQGAKSHIDASRSHLNYSLAGPDTAKEISELAKRLMADAGIKTVRKDCVRAIEILFSLPVGFAGDQRGFFTACLNWCASRFGGAKNVLSFDVHLDEAAIHAHCLLLPLSDGKMRGSDMVGGRQALAGHQESFHREVASHFGFSRAPKQVRGNQKAKLSELVFHHMKRTNDAALNSPAWQSIRAAIASNPVPFAQAYGLTIESQPKKGKTFTQIMTAAAKPEPSKRVASNPIGFNKLTPAKHQTLSCVGFGIAADPISAPIADSYNGTNGVKLPRQSEGLDLSGVMQVLNDSISQSSEFWQMADSVHSFQKTFSTFEAGQRSCSHSSELINTPCNLQPLKVIRFSLGHSACNA
jgi:Plasmid recombination enzyme